MTSAGRITRLGRRAHGVATTYLAKLQLKMTGIYCGPDRDLPCGGAYIISCFRPSLKAPLRTCVPQDSQSVELTPEKRLTIVCLLKPHEMTDQPW